jgi:hypothetical protein
VGRLQSGRRAVTPAPSDARCSAPRIDDGSVLLVVLGLVFVCVVHCRVPGRGRPLGAASHPFVCVAAHMERFDTNGRSRSIRWNDHAASCGGHDLRRPAPTVVVAHGVDRQRMCPSRSP